MSREDRFYLLVSLSVTKLKPGLTRRRSKYIVAGKLKKLRTIILDVRTVFVF
nr:MAG TPA: hypothetical protein [Caudoviricetes sp.]